MSVGRVASCKLLWNDRWRIIWNQTEHWKARHGWMWHTTQVVTEGGGRCVCSLSILPKLDSAVCNFGFHLVFAIDKTVHEQMQNSHCAHLVPSYSNCVGRNLHFFKTSVTAELTVSRIFRFFSLTLLLCFTCRINYPKHKSHLLFRISQKKQVVQRNVSDDKWDRILKDRDVVVCTEPY